MRIHTDIGLESIFEVAVKQTDIGPTAALRSRLDGSCSNQAVENWP